jgi:hypothetical protein
MKLLPLLLLLLTLLLAWQAGLLAAGRTLSSWPHVYSAMIMPGIRNMGPP